MSEQTVTIDQNVLNGAAADEAPPAIGSLVEIRDEEWIVESCSRVADGWRVTCRGVSELVRDTSAIFYSALDPVEVVDPARARLVADDSPGYRRTRLWLEAMLRKTPVPLHQDGLSVAHRMMLDPLAYQRRAVAQALSLENLRPRILIADAVGLGKTLEIGMIISELARRGRADRVLVVTPRHVLEQMQRELWTRFAVPLVRLDSEGIQRVRQELPATRNPFTFYPRVIVSVDTLKSERYRAHLQKQRWDVVVVDESHNLTNTGTRNHQLATVLAPNTEALILASATPHNGKPESFAALVDLLDPTAIVDRRNYAVDDIKRLFVRRHRHSPDVEREVGHHWAEREEPEMLPFDLSDAEEAVVAELWDTWLNPDGGRAPSAGKGRSLFPWTLAKAFLSSPHALLETVQNRRAVLRRAERTAGADAEDDALSRLEELAEAAVNAGPAKLTELVRRLQQIGVGPRSPTRVVCFTERLATLRWLQTALPKALGLPEAAFDVLHGTLPDTEQMAIVERFGLAGTPVRVLLTGDVASEGVNLHRQCHHLVHVDLPWSLIRIEQRNGRIDRYGQTEAPRIAALIGTTRHDKFSADVRVLAKLLAKEHAAHRALGDAASLMRLHDADAEEDAVQRALAERRDLDEVVPDPRAADRADGEEDWSFDELFADAGEEAPPEPPVTEPPGLFASDLDYLREALAEVFRDPSRPPDAGPDSGVGWTEHPQRRLVELRPPADLRRRLAFLPQDYLAERGVRDRLVLATSVGAGEQSLAEARRHESSSQWPEAHFLGPLHPVLEWATDRALARIGRGEVPVVFGAVPAPTVLVQGVLHNERGQVLMHALRAVVALDPNALVVREDAIEAIREAGVGPDSVNRGLAVDADAWAWLIPAVVARMTAEMTVLSKGRLNEVVGPVREAATRIRAWRRASEELAAGKPGAQAARLRRRIEEHGAAAQDLARAMADTREPLVRPLVAVLPEPTAEVRA
jgi:superfamily II DNA or RNA helicase